MDTITYAAAITLYNPLQDYIENVIAYSTFFPYVIVNDNTSGEPPYRNILEAIPNIIYFGDGTNMGLPVAFNRSLQWSREHHIDYLCTLDQDSKLGKEETNAIIAFIESNKDDNTAIVAPSPLFLGIPDHSYDDSHGFVEEVNWTICSGSFLNVKLLFENDIKYDEAYFVDRFDADLSRQIYNKGYKQLILHNVRMPHILGDAGEHSALRNYYIFRNRLYFNN